MTSTGVISAVRVTHRTATVEEIAAAGGDDQRADVAALLAEPGVEETYVLRTCNRVEAYVVADDARTGRNALSAFVADVSEDAVVESDHEDSLHHMMRVAAGVESMVVGEDRILGQVRDAYEDAREADGIGPVLEQGVTKAIHVGERVRNETAINEGIVSLGSAGAEFLADRVAFEGATALVVGAGEIASTVVQALAARGIDDVVIANRTVENAAALAEDVEADATARGLDALPEAFADADVAVAATDAPTPLVDADAIAGAGETAVVDMGQPPNVAADVRSVEGVDLYDLDALQAVTERTREHRRQAAQRAETVIEREFEHLLEEYKRKRADEVIAAMHEGAERIKARELRTAVDRLEAAGDLNDDQREVVESLADALVGQLLAAPTESLRSAAAEDDWTTIATAIRLFDPGTEGASLGADGDGPPEGIADRMPPEVVDQLSGDGGPAAPSIENVPDEVVDDMPEDVVASLRSGETEDV